jgi:hypothetical protein
LNVIFIYAFGGAYLGVLTHGSSQMGELFWLI